MLSIFNYLQIAYSTIPNNNLIESSKIEMMPEVKRFISINKSGVNSVGHLIKFFNENKLLTERFVPSFLDFLLQLKKIVSLNNRPFNICLISNLIDKVSDNFKGFVMMKLENVNGMDFSEFKEYDFERVKELIDEISNGTLSLKNDVLDVSLKYDNTRQLFNPSLTSLNDCFILIHEITMTIDLINKGELLEELKNKAYYNIASNCINLYSYLLSKWNLPAAEYS